MKIKGNFNLFSISGGEILKTSLCPKTDAAIVKFRRKCQDKGYGQCQDQGHGLCKGQGQGQFQVIKVIINIKVKVFAKR